jgi:hypothetical protein
VQKGEFSAQISKRKLALGFELKLLFDVRRGEHLVLRCAINGDLMESAFAKENSNTNYIF